MSYNELSARERISACHIDLMSDKEFSRLGPTTQIGVVHVVSDIPTAKTNGLDVWYSEDWVMKLSRQQLRYVISHEALHKLYQHCTMYTPEFRLYPDEAAQAVDYVVNLSVEDMDKGRGFVARPTDIPPLVDPRYIGFSCLEVLADLIQNPPPPPPQGGGGSNGKSGAGDPMDEHEQREIQPEEQAAEEQMLNDARIQGEMTSARMRGEGAGSESLKGFERTDTNWIDPLRQYLTETMEGDDQSRWCPPNKLFRPMGIILPSHYSEVAGELVVACDTSASMRRYYARIFGEIGMVCEQLQPKQVTVIWWDTKVAGTQVFGPSDYLTMKDKLKAKGGGGTTVSCVAQYMQAKKMKPQATIILTDGEVESRFDCPTGPLLWGVVGGARFQPPRGKVLKIGKGSL